ncbi:AAA family ATPase [Bernardetia sp. OM2101]|uniref:AAA family ATPase n=1 Tax=Bernardetia sp. OM2101 TaxID=3344876 RepID=UPI0035D0A8A7
MNFYSKRYGSRLNGNIQFPYFVLSKISWNDHGYTTSFVLSYHSSSGLKGQIIGNVKILNKKADYDIDLNDGNDLQDTILESNFETLSSDYASLGQSQDYYDNLKRMFPNEYLQILDSLNDIALLPGIWDEIEYKIGFKKSLTRGSTKEFISVIRNILYDNNELSSVSKFSYQVQLQGVEQSHVVKFNFEKYIKYGFRTIVIIGKNGTGKTQYLHHLSLALSDNNALGEFVHTDRPLVSRVIAISFSLFDDFQTPEPSKHSSYKYIGFRHNNRIISPQEISERLTNAFNHIKFQEREQDWFFFINKIIFFDGINNRELEEFISNEDFAKIIENREILMSSGQNIILFVITELIATLRNDSIILYDEPETHLHPNAIAKFQKVLNSILIKYNSYAIVATHSPIIVQETPSANVILFDRVDNIPIIKPLPDEFFGESISNITDKIFYKNEVKAVYQEFFESCIEQGYSEEQINEIFGDKLGLNARLYIAAIANTKK